MRTLAAQYLEHAPPDATPALVRQRLRQAFDTLPLSIIALGWDLPHALEDAVADESARHGARLYRWHPLLASDAGFVLPEEWQPLNVQGEAVPGFRDLPEFTFLCPNRSDVQEWIAERIEVAAQRGIYQGLFFDRMRFPSPAENPGTHLACFCKYCRRLASDLGLDLEAARRQITSYLADVDRAQELARTLFAPTEDSLLESFFSFRAKSVTQVIQYASRLARSHGLGVGLDCFSPTLARMVGQDLSALDAHSDWVKLMIYPRVLGPAGLPYELNALAGWLKAGQGLSETEAVEVVGRSSGLPIERLDSQAISQEIQRGRDTGVTNLLAGVALVELEGIHRLTLEQVSADLAACQREEVDGVVLSWDLWHIPQQYLAAVAGYIPH
jgi:hypothetical protein